MSMSDPIADLFTRIRNDISAGKKKSVAPYSGIKERIAKSLQKAGFVAEVQVVEVEGRRSIHLRLALDRDGTPILRHLQRVSTPGRRLYVGSREIRRVQRGMGVGLYSTSKGVLTDRECREQRVGGEYLGRFW